MEDTEKKNASTSKIAAEKEVSKEISPNDIYDRIFKRILTLSGKAVINLINGLFETCYSENSILTYNWTEFETDKLRKILADGIITVNGTDAFHFEAEISDDNIIFRMLEYGFHHGLRTMKTIIDPETNELSYRFSFPRQVIIYLDSAEKIPDEQIIQIDFGYQGSFTYKVPVVHFQKEKPETIKKKGMVILLPFKLLSLRKEINKSRSEENKKRLIDLYQNDILSVIDKATDSGELTSYDSKKLRSMTRRLMVHLYFKYEDIREEIIMRDHSIDLDIDEYADRVDELEEQLASKDEQLASKDEQITEQDNLIRELKERLARYESV